MLLTENTLVLKLLLGMVTHYHKVVIKTQDNVSSAQTFHDCSI